ncbi:large-conductance mechanosensitive channel protein MscL [Candidatus Kuenenbacteria bacterium]|nr:large-conductance mechanosensitive channel protein MscL [Candidatus Kuenenbacteria bacterium]
MLKKTLQEFKEFAVKGNVMDLAVAVVIGGAFGKIVSSLVNDIIMPIVGVILGGVNFTHLTLTLKSAKFDPAGVKVAEAVTLTYGSFVQALVDFLIIAWVIFMLVKIINSLKRREEKPAEPVEPPATEKLLTEIRDILNNKQ